MEKKQYKHEFTFRVSVEGTKKAPLAVVSASCLLACRKHDSWQGFEATEPARRLREVVQLAFGGCSTCYVQSPELIKDIPERSRSQWFAYVTWGIKITPSQAKKDDLLDIVMPPERRAVVNKALWEALVLGLGEWAATRTARERDEHVRRMSSHFREHIVRKAEKEINFSERLSEFRAALTRDLQQKAEEGCAKLLGEVRTITTKTPKGTVRALSATEIRALRRAAAEIEDGKLSDHSPFIFPY